MKFLRYIAIMAACIAALCASAFSPETFAPASRLAQGRWVKVSVPANGLYCITTAQLRQWGFADPAAVRVYGYGGNRIGNVLSESDYVDDLPLVQSELTDRGIVFYGLGPSTLAESANGMLYDDYSIYTTAGYYFLSDTAEDLRPIPAQGSPKAAAGADEAYTEVLHYELDATSPGEAGWLLVGESFKVQPTRKFTFKAAPAAEMQLECGIVSHASAPSQVQFTVNAQALPANASDRLPATQVSSYNHGTYSLAYHQIDGSAMQGAQIDVTVAVPSAASMRDCWLDYLCLNVRRPLALPASGALCFRASSASAVLASAAADTRVWDVTDPLNITSLATGADAAGGLQWTNAMGPGRDYAIWQPAAQLPAPKFVEKVANQNLHALPCVDMVIFTPSALAAQARRIADYHASAPQPLSVAVLELGQVYNEFASGSADISALRRCMKMLFDRGEAADSLPALRYALLMGRATYDNRHLTSQFESPTSRFTVPVWMTGVRSAQLTDNSGYGTDDFIAMLADGSGASMGVDKLSVAVGRIPSHNADEARSDVDKLLQYLQKSKPGTWRNSILVLADNGNNGEFVYQSEKMIAEINATPGSQAHITKVYVDAYDIIGGSCQGGRDLMYRTLNEGTAWWIFNGHANNHGWTSENMLNFTDINNLYLQKLPVLLGATCDFLKWDSNTLSGGEILFHERYGGIIATISATRPVYITANGQYTQAFGRAVNMRSADGRMPRLGDIYRHSKNDIRNDKGNPISDTNRLRYVLMGDPALPIVFPSHIITLDSIAGQPVDPEAQPTLMALQRATIAGSVLNPDGSPASDFDGTAEIDIYDAERSLNTQGKGDDEEKIIFEQHGEKLFSGSARVQGGKFSIQVSMPGEVADNFRPATMNMSAYSPSTGIHAAGLSKDFYVYGLDDSAPADAVAPVIEWFGLNHATFEPGATVNESPMAIANIRDDVGINLSMAGVGHQMTLTLDGAKTYTDVSQYFSPNADGTPSGSIAYPLDALTPGPHSLRLRIWDTSGNSATQEIAFNVATGIAPTIFDVYTDANPARDQANFYISHDRPDAQVTVTVSVYNLLGRPVWQSTVTGRSDMFESTPVTWDLTDAQGRRVPRGIYLYRATISEPNAPARSTASRKLAVAAP